MGRDLTAGMASGVNASTVRPFLLMEFVTTITTHYGVMVARLRRDILRFDAAHRTHA